MATVPKVSVVKLLKAVVLPTEFWKMVAPEVFTVKFLAPLRVLPKVMSPAPVLLNVLSTLKVTAPL